MPIISLMFLLYCEQITTNKQRNLYNITYILIHFSKGKAMYIIQKKKSITVWKTLKYHNGKRAEFSTIQKAKAYLDKYLD